MAQCRPVVVIPGMNHGHFSNGVANTARGDLAAEVAQGPGLQVVASHMLRFMAANHPGTIPEVAAAAVEQLLTATEASLDFLSPYTAALGEHRGKSAGRHAVLEMGGEGRGASVGCWLSAVCKLERGGGCQLMLWLPSAGIVYRCDFKVPLPCNA